MGSYDEERDKDVQSILNNNPLGEPYSKQEVIRMLTSVWSFGWSAGFAYQGTVDAALEKEHPERDEVEKHIAEKLHKAPVWRTYRDAGTGEFVTPAYAKEHPETTVSETHHRYPPEVAQLVEFDLKEKE